MKRIKNGVSLTSKIDIYESKLKLSIVTGMNISDALLCTTTFLIDLLEYLSKFTSNSHYIIDYYVKINNKMTFLIEIDKFTKKFVDITKFKNGDKLFEKNDLPLPEINRKEEKTNKCLECPLHYRRNIITLIEDIIDEAYKDDKFPFLVKNFYPISYKGRYKKQDIHSITKDGIEVIVKEKYYASGDPLTTFVSWKDIEDIELLKMIYTFLSIERESITRNIQRINNKLKEII